MRKNNFFAKFSIALIAGCLGVFTGILAISRPIPAYSNAIENRYGVERRQQEGWSKAVNLTKTSSDSLTPSLAADPEGGIHLVWAEALDGGPFLHYTRLQGEEWLQPNDVVSSQSGAGLYDPSLVCDAQGYLHLIYTENGIRYSKAFAPLAWSAKNWDTPQRIAPPISSQTRGRLAVGPDDNPRVVYSVQVGTGSGIYLLQSLDEGLSWDKPLLVYENLSQSQMVSKPEIAIDGRGKIHVIWVENNFPETYPPIGIRYSSSEDGLSWSEPVSLADGPYDDPKIFANSAGEVHVVWSGTASDRFKFHRRSRDGGDNWLAIWKNEVLGGLQGYPALVQDGDGKLHWLQVGSVFTLQTSDTSNQDSLYHNIFSNGVWSTGTILIQGSIPEQNLSNVSAAVSLGNELHVVVANPLRTQANQYQYDIFYLHRRLDSAAIAPLPLATSQVIPTQPEPTRQPAPTATRISLPPSDPGALAQSESPLSGVVVGAVAGGLVVIIMVVIRIYRKR